MAKDPSTELQQRLDRLEKAVPPHLMIKFNQMKDHTRLAIRYANGCAINMAVANAIFAQRDVDELDLKMIGQYHMDAITKQNWEEYIDATMGIVVSHLSRTIEEALSANCECKKGKGFASEPRFEDWATPGDEYQKS